MARNFFKYEDGTFGERIINGSMEKRVTVEEEEVTSSIDDKTGILHESESDMNSYCTYESYRSQAYPSIQDQLDKMYHDGFDAWKETIKAVKDANPKPE